MINQSTMLVGKIHGKLLILDPALEETRGRALMAVRNLASHNAIAVIDSLLAQHPLPFDDAVVRSTFSPLTPAKRRRGVGTRGAKGQLPYQCFRIIVVKTSFCPTNIKGF